MIESIAVPLMKLKNNSYTSKYCSLKNQLKQLTDSNKETASTDSLPFYVIGISMIIPAVMIASYIFVLANNREIVAFKTQQIMPVAKEGIDEMTPTIGNATREIAKK